MNKKITHYFALAAAFFGILSNKSVNAQGANTYQYSAVAGTYTNMATGTAFTAVQADDVCPTTTIPLGFTFNFCGIDYTTIRASSNGYMTFSTGTASTAANATSSFATIKPALFWLWDDLDGATGTALYATTGTAPNRIFTFQYKNWEWNWSTTGPNISCQVKLYESTNIIEYQYNPESAAGNPSGSGGASIGICDGLATPTYLSLNNGTATATASSTVFTDAIVTKPVAGQIYRFKPVPPIDLKMDSVVMNANFCSNATAPVSVQISNKGTATITDVLLNWSVDGIAQPPVSYTLTTPVTNFTTAPNNTAIVPLGDVFFPNNTAKVIKAWVVQANSLPDAVNTNDTVTASKAPSLTGVIANVSPQDTIVCSGTTLTLDAGEYPKNPIYIWNTAQITRTITISEGGTYIVKVQNTDGCFDYDTVVITTHPSPLINSVAVIDYGGGDFVFNAIGAQNITHHTWNFGDNTGDLTLPGAPGQQMHSYALAGDYTVTLTVGNDCGDLVVTKVLSTEGPNQTGIGNLTKLQRAFAVFPNPSNALVTIANNDDIEIQSVSVYSLVGQKIMTIEGINKSKVSFSVDGIAAGIYNVVVDTKLGTFTKKLEVSK